MSRRGAGGLSRPSSSGKRRVFTKLLKDKNATVSNISQAARFVEGMETFESKAELLAQLDDSRYMGMQRIRDVLSFTNSLEDIEKILIPLLNHLMTEETGRPVYRGLRNKILMAIYSVPGLMDTLVLYNVARDLSTTSASLFCSFLRAITKAFLEPRKSLQVIEMSKALRERGDVDEAKVLCTFLLIDERDPEGTLHPQDEEGLLAGKSPTTACWVTDFVPPGGRHDNDHLNYRDVRVLPTIEELTCTTPAYLPLASGENTFIQDPVSSLLDRNFRLLREDAVSTMKQNLLEPTRGVWKNARIIGLEIGSRGSSWGTSFVIQLDKQSRGNPVWKYSRALMIGSVVALCREGKAVRMGTISIREDSTEWLDHPVGPKIGVTFESREEIDASVEELTHNGALELTISNTRKELSEASAVSFRRQTLDKRMNVCSEKLESYDLVEVSRSFFAYQPILKSLQEMESLPLSDKLVGCSPGNARPDYLPERVVLPSDDNFQGHEINFNESTVEEVAEKTSMDASQAKALRHALKSPVALIQGPPGTGKTFIGALVARIIRENTDETILCVCYTNHALDQFLEHMLSAGETRLVRIGGRSKSERLAKYQLQMLSRSKSSPDSFSQRRTRQVDAQLFKLKEDIQEAVKRCEQPIQWRQPFGGIRAFLEYDEPDILGFLQLPQMDDGFEIIGPNGKKVSDDILWEYWRKGEDPPEWLLPYIDIHESKAFETFWTMSFDERISMIEQWRRDILLPDSSRINDLMVDFNSLLREKQSLRQDMDLQILRDARIIGATTSGAAKYRDILSEKAAGVVLVEEAGEVLEAHVLASLSEMSEKSDATKHLILIGDHKQLRPKVESYDLSTVSGVGYNLDCSLFERLVLAGHPSVSLNVQHRMRPSISKLIRAQTYPSLQDHDSVFRYPAVKGVSDSVIFVHHHQFEDGADMDDATTKSNAFEATMCIELVRFFLLQGYRTDQIVVLTPYLGQLLKIIHLMKSSLGEVTALVSEKDARDLEQLDEEHQNFENLGAGLSRTVRCSSIDNFQGEEADIVVLSLVRSNRHGNIGFLKEEQRVNVLLSRARHGMFIVGSASTLRSSRKGRIVWMPILDMLESEGRLRTGLPTTCQLHPDDEPVELSIPDHFRTIRPNGGCNRPCRCRLSCGHVCPMMCHPIDRDHRNAQKMCCEPCKRFPPECPKGHTCPKLCKDPCGPCCAPVGPVSLNCGHTAERARCHDVRSPSALKEFSSRCQTIFPHKFAKCGHEVETTCANSRSSDPQCPALCGSLAKCGHPCSKRCTLCDGDHKCNEQCNRILFCGHPCDRPCHLPHECRPCTKSCEASCSHSSCPEKCRTPCASCVEPCDWDCEHQGSCPLVCGAPCCRLPCNERCEKLLSCGHRCPSLCGEPCASSDYCLECCEAKFKTRVVDMICFSTYQEHDIDDDPILFLPCGHFFAVSTLDGLVDITSVYETDESGRTFTGLLPLRGNGISEKPKQCPECRSVVHSINRYGRILRLTELRNLERKHIAKVKQTLDIFSSKVNKPDARLIERLKELELTIRRSPMNVIYEACGGADVVETAPPPPAPLIKCIELRALAFEALASKYNDDNFAAAKLAYGEAILVAESSQSIRSVATLRLALAKLLVKYCSGVEPIRKEVEALLDSIIVHGQRFEDIVTEALNLKEKLEKPNIETIKEIVSAMNRTGGYDYGGSASSHWYECPNGHPFFIGECGGAMQESFCIECGECIGGTRHTLPSSNRRVGGIVREALGG